MINFSYKHQNSKEDYIKEDLMSFSGLGGNLGISDVGVNQYYCCWSTQ